MKLARFAGVLYLIVAVTMIFAGVVNTRVAESGNATLYRIGFVSELVGAVAFLATAMALYVLLEHVNRMAAAAMVTIVAISVAIQSMNLLNQNTALAIATSQEYSPLARLFASMYTNGYQIAQTFFGLWLLPLGYLVAKSGYFPTPLGPLLVAGCAGHLVDVFARFLAPGFGADISPFALTVAAVAELSFIAWLLLKPVTRQHPR
jgi:hypothetical protein